MTVGAAAASAIVAAAGRGIQGAGLGEAPHFDGGTFVTLSRDPAVQAALGASSAATSVAQMVASGNLASHARLAQTRYFAPGGIPSWK
jgi:hypothetical protein